MLEIRSLNKSFGKNIILKDIDLALEKGEILGITGASGSGKSTLLRIIAQLIDKDSGELKIAAKTAMMFQDYALFPHLSVYENIAFALDKNKNKKEITNNLLKKLNILSIKDKQIDEISGGQAQRVAFARAIAPGCELLLLDEPFASLDQHLKARLRLELKSLIKAQKLSAIMVTHDIEDAFLLCDKIAILQAGSFIDIKSPKELFYGLKTASFFKEINIIDTKELDPSDPFHKIILEKKGIFSMSEFKPGSGFSAKIEELTFLGAYYKLGLNYKGLRFSALLSSKYEFKEEFFSFDFI